MRWSGRTIWDTRVQGVSGILTAYLDGEVQLFASATFAQVSIKPPRVVINPNRTYGIEEAVRKSGRFAINVLPTTSHELMVKLMRMRRREPAKAEILGLTILDHQGIPYLDGNLRTIFCEVEKTVEGGDRHLYIGNVLQSRINPDSSDQMPLLFSQVSDTSTYPRLRGLVRATAIRSGALDIMKRFRNKLRAPPEPNIAATTYQEAGSTDQEIQLVLEAGALDRSRKLRPPSTAIVPNKPLGVCIV